MCSYIRYFTFILFLMGSNNILASTVQRLSPSSGVSSSVTLYVSKWLYHLEPEYIESPVLESLEIDLLRNETGYIQLHIDNPKNEIIEISTVTSAGFDSSFHEIAKIYEIDPSGARIGFAMLDPLRAIGPAANLGSESEKDLLLEYSPSRSQTEGVHEGGITLKVGGSAITYKISVNVNSLALEQGSVGTQLFNLDSRSLAYDIGYPTWHPEFRTYAIKIRDMLADHHISPSRLPFLDALDSDRFPEVVRENGSDRKHLLFSANDEIALAAPKFEQLGSNYSFSVDFSSAVGSAGEFARYVWGGRQSGFKLSLVDSLLTIHLGSGDRYQKFDLAKIKNHSEINRLEVHFDNDELVWSLEGYQSGAIRLPKHALRSAYGGEFFIRSNENGFRVYDVAWQGQELDYVSFDAIVADLDKLLRAVGPVGKESSQLLAVKQQIKWLESASLWENDVTAWLDLPSTVDKEPRPDLHRSHITLPRDEAVKGPAMAHNIRAAKLYEKSGYKIFHTLGSMHNKGINREEVLLEYAKYVDILSVRPRVYLLEKEFFANYEGEVSLYLHDTHWAYNANNLMNARLIFWFGQYHGIDMYSYWNVNLWFQAYKNKHRTGRYSRKVGNDFEFTKRNPSGIHSGVLIYPGETGPLSSLQLIAWSKGIEDQWLFMQAKKHGVKVIDIPVSGGMDYATWVQSVRPQDFRKQLGSVDFGKVKSKIADRIVNRSR